MELPKAEIKKEKESGGKEEQRELSRQEIRQILSDFQVPEQIINEVLFLGAVNEIEKIDAQNVSGVEIKCLGISYISEKDGKDSPRSKFTIIRTPFVSVDPKTGEKMTKYQFQCIRPTKKGNLAEVFNPNM